jgi:hypothetical protein
LRGERPRELIAGFSHDLLLAPRAHRPYRDGMRFLIVFLLLAVAASLFSGLYFVGNDRGGTNRAVISLTVRIGLSLVVFALLMASHVFGWSLE